MTESRDARIDHFEAVDAGSNALLRLGGSGVFEPGANALVVQAPGRAQQLRPLRGAEPADPDGGWRVSFAIEHELLDAATRFTLLTGGRPLALEPPGPPRTPRAAREELEARLERSEADRERLTAAVARLERERGILRDRLAEGEAAQRSDAATAEELRAHIGSLEERLGLMEQLEAERVLLQDELAR